MRITTRLFVLSSAAVAILAAQPQVPLYQKYLSPASPQEVVAAAKADRVAWVDYAEGKRNAYAAAAPRFAPVRLTNFLKDDGIMMSGIKISDDGGTVVFLRGEQVNREGWAPNPTADPNGPEHAIWAARTSGVGGAWRVVDATNPELAPDGSAILFVKAGQIYRAKVTPVKPATEVDRGEKAFITEWGVQSDPKWSPDGRKIAFVSTRTDHSFIVVYDVAARSVKYMSPSVDFDSMPMWQPDSKHLIFVRRPGLPFGQQAQQGAGGIGLPNGPAAAAATTATAGRGGGRNAAAAAEGRGAGRNAAAAATTPAVVNNSPGLMQATFKGGYTLAFYKADVLTGDAQETWHNQPKDTLVSNLANPHLAGNFVIFPFNVGGGRGGRGGRGGAAGRGAAPAEEAAAPATPAAPVDEWERYYTLNVTDASARPVLLTTTDGMIENQTSIAVSPDGKTFYYCTNAKDIELRHIWAVPASGGTPVQITTGEGVETSPAPLASGKYLATLSASWKMPQSLGMWKMGAEGAVGAANPQQIVFPTSRPGFPIESQVKPEIVITKAADGLEIHNQLFLPKDLKPGERRPAIVFVHGGPQRQMMPAYHYMQFYHWAYGINQWLANQGYVVMSINYRSGVGYGRSFRTAPNTGGAGNSEYQDVLAGGKYLQTRADVDPDRIGIWGLSYGGVLTSQALARNSDIFKAGVDLAGVHLWGSSLDPNSVSYKSSTIGAIDGWKSPVLLIQGDDDRNVAFQQMTGLVQLLRQRDVYYELVVFPDDVHESLLHSRWIYTLGRMETFLHKFLGDPTVAASK
ncbi:MAG TPA: prolyl oligopeptidase family serine peptidase [Candidatus Sulfopaludibacter sp.]|jgi:dipeptidyl aminopeptidase/acylaminoacyl peptidase|nr:prolyl oligopeptidase family serine peptidase [Candidatus Sulfopaludibacter sp.]